MSDREVELKDGWPPLWLLVRVSLLTNWRRLKAIRHQSRFLTAVILAFVLSYLVLAFWLFLVGLRFVGRFPGLGIMLTERLLFLLFAFLFVLLLLSNLIISYTNLFRNRETAFLLSLPVPSQTIFQWKFIESTVLASWAFLFLAAPLLAAFGLTRGVAWHFYLVTAVQVGLFIILPAAFGSFLAVNVARFLDRRLFQVLALTLVLALLGLAAYAFRPDPIPEELADTRVPAVLDRLLNRTRFAENPVLPSQWLSTSILRWAEGAVRGAFFLMLLLLSHVLFFGTLVLGWLGDAFQDAASVVQSRASLFGRWGWRPARARTRPADLGPTLGERMMRGLWWLGPDVRALIVKDARAFWRDTTQWGQSIVLFGLLGVYFLNLRHFSQQLHNPFWVHLVSFLNLGACSLNLATLTTRFVYPQFSLEGKRLWIVGLAPLGLPRVLLAKFWMAASGALLVTLGLIGFSCYMLQMALGRTLFFGAAVTTMTFTLTGLAVGLGALYPNFKEDNPSKIVSGFGGTFCLVLSFLYILASVILLAFASPWSGEGLISSGRAVACLGGFVGISWLLGWLPMRAGLRRVGQFEL